MQCIEDQCNVLTRVQRIQPMQCALLALSRMLEYLHLINISSNIHTVALANPPPPTTDKPQIYEPTSGVRMLRDQTHPIMTNDQENHVLTDFEVCGRVDAYDRK